MERQTYRQGWLPGYVYGMVADRPGQDLYRDAKVESEDRPRVTPDPLPEPAVVEEPAHVH